VQVWGINSAQWVWVSKACGTSQVQVRNLQGRSGQDFSNSCGCGAGAEKQNSTYAGFIGIVCRHRVFRNFEGKLCVSFSQ